MCKTIDQLKEGVIDIDLIKIEGDYYDIKYSIDFENAIHFLDEGEVHVNYCHKDKIRADLQWYRGKGYTFRFNN